MLGIGGEGAEHARAIGVFAEQLVAGGGGLGSYGGLGGGDGPGALGAWRSAVRYAAGGTRDLAAQRLHAVLPLTLALGGERAVEAQVRALQDVTRWWR